MIAFKITPQFEWGTMSLWPKKGLWPKQHKPVTQNVCAQPEAEAENAHVRPRLLEGKWLLRKWPVAEEMLDAEERPMAEE